MNTDNKYNICIIGAGVVGLAIAENLSRFYNKIILVDKEKKFGQHISSRNSEVIHSGFFYKKNSLKAKLCKRGNELIYRFANKYKIRYNNCGKLIISNNKNEKNQLNDICRNSIDNGVKCKIIDSFKEFNEIEPEIKFKPSLWVPSSGIIDSHGFMSKLEYLSRKRNVDFLYNYKVKKILKTSECYQILLDNSKDYINAKIVINSGGLWSHDISRISNIANYEVEYYKGDYYKCKSIRNLNCLVYPIPSNKSLGLHAVLNLNGEISFGPNIYKVNSVDYKIDDRYKKDFLSEINKNFNINENDIYPDFSGIRPKIKFSDNFNDFIIKNEYEQGYYNFINLIGIDSPGLTSSLAIAEYVNKQIF